MQCSVWTGNDQVARYYLIMSQLKFNILPSGSLISDELKKYIDCIVSGDNKML